MSRANPRKAVAAAMPLPAAVAPGVTVKPMTLAMWAALERIDSPLLPGGKPKDALELLPSLYLLTHGAEEIFKGNLVELSMAWADTVPVEMLEAVRLAAARQISTVAAVIPEDDDGAPKKKRTARSPRSSSSDAPASAGLTRSASSASRSRCSPSSTGATPSRPAASSRSR